MNRPLLKQKVHKESKSTLNPYVNLEGLYQFLLHAKVIAFDEEAEKPYSCDLAKLFTYPKVLSHFISLFGDIIASQPFELLSAPSLSGLLLASHLSLHKNWPLLLYHKGKMMGDFVATQTVLLVNGTSSLTVELFDCLDILRKEGLHVKEIYHLIDMEEGTKLPYELLSLTPHALIKITDIIDYGFIHKKITSSQHQKAIDYIAKVNL